MKTSLETGIVDSGFRFFKDTFFPELHVNGLKNMFNFYYISNVNIMMYIHILICIATSVKKLNVTPTALHNSGFRLSWYYLMC
jgi:hypothetical protein